MTGQIGARYKMPAHLKRARNHWAWKRRKMRYSIILCMLISAFASFAGGLFKTGHEFSPFERSRYFVKRDDLNKPVPPYKVYFFVQTSGSQTERRLSLIVTLGRASTRYTGIKRKLPGQVKPYMALWQIRDSDGVVQRQWEPHFRNRTRSRPGDDYLTTIFSLPEAELKQSHLLLYFEDIDGDGKSDDVTFDLDMTDFDWSPTPQLIRKPVVQ